MFDLRSCSKMRPAFQQHVLTKSPPRCARPAMLNEPSNMPCFSWLRPNCSSIQSAPPYSRHINESCAGDLTTTGKAVSFDHSTDAVFSSSTPSVINFSNRRMNAMKWPQQKQFQTQTRIQSKSYIKKSSSAACWPCSNPKKIDGQFFFGLFCHGHHSRSHTVTVTAQSSSSSSPVRCRGVWYNSYVQQSNVTIKNCHNQISHSNHAESLGTPRGGGWPNRFLLT